ncbi:N-(5-amino-5-carboxypentanoyl)-L-cysteinyl-D-valine synthase [Sodiomyces alkalinus F11]|uniref:N-(5-amino-5-carboxypentanoyl)-L-cysteinyl-D-valine synthase n=1 Tax=Sodiomyces alkalinus (strain CBS 110278 / VKM F-3762 / F11) TaxID=1314773 RepID=A0A3N2QAP4_SODAK|nr:N-(5-amino-5-carboxypentanoyl)-L-cysteinyl-D-valine synthase [Sodiomyces alkalinus F11]ROT43822.1 N-(5-amino-5-carboxypentanoyl)-L-cysteinyl-D-valine synthase [Sodiomyces alkalinus F11]
MYTSGSTGTPKGVGIPHGAATQSLLAHDRHIPGFQRFLQFASPTFDVSVFEVFFPLFRGCTIVSCDRATMLDDLPGIMRRLNVDACELTPTVAASLLRTRANVPSLKLLLTIGEMLTEPVVKEFGSNETRPSILWGMYGPTEAAIHCTLQVAFSGDSSHRVIGGPLDTVSCFVVKIPKEDNNYSIDIVPVGEIGELVVGGYQLARDYLNRPDQTHQAFIDSPYGRLYRTGDKGRIRPDGTLECLGRISDGQVKLRGQRIELGEVEHAAMRAPECRAAAAMVIESILIVFCLLEQGATSAELQFGVSTSCRRWLPSFMVPGDVVVLTEFPTLASGKVDQKKLRSQYTTHSRNVEVSLDQADANTLEGKVASLFSKIIGTPFTPTTPFSTHGVDSLAAIRLASALRENEISATYLDILSSRSVSGLCDRIQNRDRTKDSPTMNGPVLATSMPNIDELLSMDASLRSMGDEIEGFDRCTPLQNSMLTETSDNDATYYNVVEFDFPASCSPLLIRSHLQQLALANDILRSGFVPCGPGFVRVIFKELKDGCLEIMDDLDPSLENWQVDLLHPFQVGISRAEQESRRRVLFRMHHAIYDGWTLDILIQDLTSLLEGRTPNPRRQFKDVSTFCHTLSSAILDSSRSFWADYLLGWQRTDYPRLMSRPSGKSGSMAVSRKLSISPDTLNRTATRSGWNPQVLFQAGAAFLWSAILGAQDVVIGSASSGRTIPVAGIENIMGPCIATLPLRINFGALRSVADLLKSIQVANRSSLEHGVLPLLDIRKAAGIPPGETLYDLLFVYQQSLYSAERRSSPLRELSHHDSLETKLLLEVEPTDDSFVCQITYHADAISPEQAEVMIQELDHICQHFLSQPMSQVSDAGHCLPARLKSLFNLRPSAYSGCPDLASSFEQTASNAPNSPAICFANAIFETSADVETISYAELNQRSNQVAWYLRHHHGAEGGVVGVIMEKSIMLYVAILGALKAGYGYLPLLPTTPIDRMRFILEQAPVKACLVDRETSALLLNAGFSSCSLVYPQQVDLSTFPLSNPGRNVVGSNTAFVIYTSGTTGTPKGIAVTHLNITSNLDALASIYPADSQARLLQLCSQAFDVSVFEIFFTWTIGGCLCSGTHDNLFVDLEHSIRLLDCTHLSLTPTVAALIDPRRVPKVQFLVTAGEPMTSTVAQKWMGHLFQGYGPAETTNICSVKRMAEGDYINHLGFVLPNTSALVLAPDTLNPVPLGAFGEFCFGGDQVARGYLNLPDLTSTKFVDHPEFGRIYRSGDMGRMLSDGSLLVLGRMDGQVKLRGQRVETGEIDTIITSSGIAASSASLIFRYTESSPEQLVAFYVPGNLNIHTGGLLVLDDALTASNQALFELLESRLPSYMIPTYLIPVSEIPRTSSGKVNRARLLCDFRECTQEDLNNAVASSAKSSASKQKDDENWTEAEEHIARSVSGVLNTPLDGLSRWQSLFAVGLDSITAISVSRSLESEFQRRIPISSILRHPSIARLARLMEAQTPAESTSEHIPQRPEFFDAAHVNQIKESFAAVGKDIDTILPCAPLQEAMLSTTSDSYSNQLVLRLNASVNTVQSSWDQVVQRHAILRTCFMTTSDFRYPIVQVVLSSWEISWTVSECETLEEATQTAKRGVPDALDSQIPPYSLELFKMDGETHLIFSCHHAVYDGESMHILLEEVEALVRGETLLPAPCPEPVLRHILTLPESTVDFWKRHFQGFRALTPTTRRFKTDTMTEKPAPDGLPPQPYRNRISTPLSDVLKTARSTGTSLLAVTQAIWAISLRLLRGESDVCFGNVLSGRTIPIHGIHRLASPCFNTIPLRTEVSSSMLVNELLRELQSLNSDLLTYQFTPLRLIQKLVSSRSEPLFDTILLLQPTRRTRDASVWEVVEDRGAMDVPLVCEIVPDPANDSVEVCLHSTGREFTLDSLPALAGLVGHVAERIVLHPASIIPERSDLPNELQLSLPKLPTIQLLDQGLEPRKSHPLPLRHQDEENEAWTPLEKRIRAVLSQLSGTVEQQIGRHTTIFQLGLDSINAVQVAALLRQDGLKISALDVMRLPSCASLAEKVAQSERDESESQPRYDIKDFQASVTTTVQRRVRNVYAVEKVLPCTPLQCGMLADFIQSQGHDYFNYVAFVLRDGITPSEVQNSWAKLFQHRFILRTGFTSVQSPHTTFAMVVYSPNIPLPVESYSGQDRPFNEAKWKLDSAHRALRSLELPPWRVAIAAQGHQTTMYLAIHHALYDADSLQRLLHDLGRVLKGQELQAETCPEDALSLILGAALDDGDSKQYWEQMASRTTLNRFPTLTPLIERSGQLLTEASVSRQRFSQLQQCAKTAGVSIQSLIHAAWTRVLAAYVGEDDVVFGAVLSGRNTHISDAFLPCINTVPIIARNEASNADLIDQMARYNTQLAAHQYSPLSRIQKWLGHPSTRLFDTLVVYQKLSSSVPSELPWKKVHDEGRLDYTLSLEIEPSLDDTIDVRISFRTDVLPRDQAIVILHQFDAILEDLAQYPTATESELWRRHPELMSISPPVEPEIPSSEVFLHESVETAARQTPTRVALEFVTGFQGEIPQKESWTFQDLDHMGNRVANLLASRVTGRGIVALHFDKCPEAFFSILGVLKAGCAFLALDPSAPKARKKFILEDSKAVALLVQSDSLDFRPSQPVIQVGSMSLAQASQEPVHLDPPLHKTDTCYCLYTSGTTGTPKGCEITHENTVQAMKAFQRLFEGHWDDDSKWLQFASFHFDVSVLEQYWSWSVGIPLIAAPRDLILDDIAATIRRLEITHLDLTPSLARLLDPKDVPSLGKGVFITGGEALKQEILDVWGPQEVIYNAYGPTEATIGVTMYQRVPQNGRASNIGRQFDNVGSYVFHPGTEIPVLSGAVGELCVSGKLVGKGYLNRPELTAERFPNLKEFNERVYRTGDLVRRLHNGCFDFLGRSDDQVKLRGQRLEIGEINHAIRSGVTDIHDVATMVSKHPKVDKDLLVSFVTSGQAPHPGSTLEVRNGPLTSELRQSVLRACRDKLPGYMVPSHIFEISYIPLSVNNKADMKTLTQLFKSLSPEHLLQLSQVPRRTSDAPQTDIQRAVLSVIREFTGLSGDVMSLSSNLFQLGLDSISSLRLGALFRDRGSITVSPSTILRNPVLSDLAEALSTHRTTDNIGATQEAKQRIQAFGHRFRIFVLQELRLDQDDIEYIAPCTPLQEGMLSRSLSQADEAYFVTFRLQLQEMVSLDRLRMAWEKLVSSHSILRTRFVETPSGFAQAAIRSTCFEWDDFVLDDGHEDDVDTVVSQSRSRWIERNRQSVTAPLKFLSVHRPGGRQLVVHIFHGLYDGISFDSMLKWVAKEYSGQQHSMVAPFVDALPHGPLRNFDFSRSFWSKHLGNCSFEALPKTMRGAGNHVSVRRTFAADGLDVVRKQSNTTMQSIVLGLWSTILGRCFTVGAATGVVISGRAIDIRQSEDIIGPLFNTLPFYADVKHHNWESLVKRCHDYLTTTLEFQHTPLRSIQKWCSGGRAVFDNLFVFQVDPATTPETDYPWTVVDDFAASDYPLAFEATLEADNTLHIHIAAHDNLRTEPDLEVLIDEIGEILTLVTTGDVGKLSPGSEALSDEGSPFTSPNTTNPSSTDSFTSPSTDISPPELAISIFEWTEPCLTLRKEIAALAKLPVESVSEHSPMLELGLDSIDLVSLSARLKKQGLGITTSQLVKSRTIAEMSKILGHAQVVGEGGKAGVAFDELKVQLWEAVGSSGLNIDMATVEAVLPPTPLQESMMADMLESDFERYFNHDILEVASHVNVQMLSDAWLKVVQRSPILRTTFVQLENVQVQQTFCQVVLKELPPRIRSCPFADKEDIDSVISEHRQYIREQKGRRGLLQLTFAEAKGHTCLVLSMAHVLYDGWSLALLHQDVAAAYQDIIIERPPVEPTLRLLLDSADDQCRRFWTQYLTGGRPSLVPESPSTRESTAGRRAHFAEAASTVDLGKVLSFCRENALSLQVVGQACWSAVLASRLSALDVVFGVVLSGRDTEEAQGVMFPTMNTVAVRCVLHGSARSFLGYLQETMADIHQHQRYPLRQAQVAAKQTPGRLFNTLFLLQKQPEAGVSPAGQEKVPLLTSVGGSATADFAISVELEAVGNGGLIWRVAGQDSFVGQDDVTQILHQLDRVMEYFIEPVDQNLLQFQGGQISICGLPPFTMDDGTRSGNGPELSSPAEGNRTVEDTPWSETETAIRAVVAEVAGIPTEAVCKGATCYQLGLDSISTIKVSSILRKRGIHLGVRQLLAASSVSSMATMADKAAAAGGAASDNDHKRQECDIPDRINVRDILEEAGLDNDQVDEVFPALPMQVYMMTAWQNSHGQVFYPEFKYRVCIPVTLDALRSAWSRLVGMERMLRTCLVATEDRELPFLQALLKPDAHGSLLPSPVVMPGSDHKVEEAADAACGPLVRLGLTPRDDGLWEVRLRIHHALYDAVSLAQVMRRFGELLAENDDEGMASTSKMSTWKRFVAHHSSPDVQASRREFWTEYLGGIRNAVDERAGGPSRRVSCFRRSAVADVAGLYTACSQSGIGLPSLLFAAVAKVLHGQGGGRRKDKDVVLGIYYANRNWNNDGDDENDHGLEAGSYPTLNLLPVKVSMEGSPSLMRVAEQIQRDLHLITSPVNATVGLWEVKDWTGVTVDVFVNFINTPLEGGRSDLETTWIEQVSGAGPDMEEAEDRAAETTQTREWDSLCVKKNAVRDAFPESVDVEASVREGALDLGVFGPESRISWVGVEELVDRIGLMLIDSD